MPASREGLDLAGVIEGRHSREVVYSQLSRGNRGLYMVAGRQFKYIYSAAE